MAITAICSCGDTRPHTIARRLTADGRILLLWDDGALTWALGAYVRGSAHPRTDTQRTLALRAGRLAMGEAELWDADEIPALVRASRWVAERSGLPGDVRARMRGAAALKPVWEVYARDRDGRPTVRVWRLPRMTHPELIVWDETNARGRYQVLQRVTHSALRGPSRDTFGPALIQFRTLRELSTYLTETSALRA